MDQYRNVEDPARAIEVLPANLALLEAEAKNLLGASAMKLSFVVLAGGQGRFDCWRPKVSVNSCRVPACFRDLSPEMIKFRVSSSVIPVVCVEKCAVLPGIPLPPKMPPLRPIPRCGCTAPAVSTAALGPTPGPYLIGCGCSRKLLREARPLVIGIDEYTLDMYAIPCFRFGESRWLLFSRPCSASDATCSHLLYGRARARQGGPATLAGEGTQLSAVIERKSVNGGECVVKVD
jgi:hypothetical protein